MKLSMLTCRQYEGFCSENKGIIARILRQTIIYYWLNLLQLPGTLSEVCALRLRLQIIPKQFAVVIFSNGARIISFTRSNVYVNIK